MPKDIVPALKDTMREMINRQNALEKIVRILLKKQEEQEELIQALNEKVFYLSSESIYSLNNNPQSNNNGKKQVQLDFDKMTDISNHKDDNKKLQWQDTLNNSFEVMEK